MKPAAERKRDERQRKRDAGMVCVEAWVYPQDRERLIALIHKFNRAVERAVIAKQIRG